MASARFQNAMEELRRKGSGQSGGAWKQNIDRQMETRAQQNKNQGLLERATKIPETPTPVKIGASVSQNQGTSLLMPETKYWNIKPQSTEMFESGERGSAIVPESKKIKSDWAKHEESTKSSNPVVNFIDSLFDVQNVSNAALSGMSQANKAAANTLNLIPQFVADVTGTENKFPTQKLADYTERVAGQFSEETQKSASRYGKGGEIASSLVSGTAAAVPSAVLSMLSGGAPAIAQLAPQASGIASTLYNGISAASKNPQFWTSFLNTVGNEYQDAVDKGAEPVQALLASVGSSLVNSGIEVGGGIETLPEQLRSGDTNRWLAVLKSGLEEAAEEPAQTVVSGAIQKGVFDKDRKTFSTTDENAVFNPLREAESAAMAFGTGAILGAGQNLAMSAMESGRQNRSNAQQDSQLSDAANAILEAAGQKNTADTNKNVVADTSLFDRGILKNFNQARKNLIEFARQYFPKSVVNKETGREIGISRAGLDKFLSGNILYEKYASGFHIPELIENASKVNKANNYHPETVGEIPTFEYYDSRIQIDGVPYTAHIRVKNTQVGDKYYGHTVSMVDDIKIERPTRISTASTLSDKPENTGRSISEDIVPQSMLENNQNPAQTPVVNPVQDMELSDAANAILEAAGQKNTADAGSTVNENGLISLSKLEQDNLSSGKRNKIVSTFQDAASFIRNALSNKQSNDRAYLGKIPDATAQMILDQTGIDVGGYNAILPSDAVRHMFRNHGNTKTESARGQVALTPESAAYLTSVLSSPDRVTASNRTDAYGRKTILMEKRLGDTYVTAQAVTDGTKSLITDTLYIKKGSPTTVDGSQISSNQTSETSSGPALSDSSVSQFAPENNLNPAQTPTGNPVQDIQGLGAAESGFTGDRERGFSRNLASDEARNAMIREDYQLDPEMYKTLSNKDTLKKAQDIYDKGITTARSTVESAIGRSEAGQKFPPEMVPLAKMVADDLAASGDLDGARNILSRVAVELTSAGQLGQAAKILREAGPATRISMLDKAIENINEWGRKRYKDNWNDVSLTQEEANAAASLENGDEAGFQALYQKVAQRIGKELPSTVWEKLTEVRRLAMLANPVTQIRNGVGNIPIAVARKASERLSGLIQSGLVKAGILDADKQTRTATVSKQSKEIARQLWQENGEQLLANSDKWDMGAMMRQYRKYFGDSKPGQALDAIRDFTYKMMEYGDKPFFQNAFIDSAAQMIEARGIKDYSDVKQEVIDFAAANAMEATFKDATVVASALNKIKRQGGVGGAALDIILPFTTTPINVTRQAVKYSPAGILDAIYQLKPSIGIRNGIRVNINGDISDFSDSIAKALVGSSGWAIAAILAKIGVITGAADDDKDKRNFDIMIGNQEFSIGGKISYDWAQPFASQLAAGAAIYDAIRGNDEVVDAVLNAATAAGDVIIDMSVGVQVVDAVQGFVAFLVIGDLPVLVGQLIQPA